MESTDLGPDPATGEPVASAETPPLPSGILGRWPAITYVVPFLVYMFFTAGLEGRIESKKEAYAPGGSLATPVEEGGEAPPAAAEGHGGEPFHKMPYRFYAPMYTAKIACTLLAVLLVLPGYLVWPFRINAIALVVGAVGVVVWVGLCKLNLEEKVLTPIGLGSFVESGERPGFNPLAELADTPRWAYAFLAIRLFGLALLVPLIEEFFIRGFLIRYVMDVDWFKIPFGKVDRLGLITAIALPALMHPAEVFAAMAWFGMVTWLMIRTRNIWDCVAAHAVTNALLGAYVLATGEWQLM